MKKKILVYNIMQFTEKIQFFNEGIQREVDATGIEVEYMLPHQKDLFNRIDEFSHLIISGSEASAKDDLEWTDELTELIKAFIEKGKKILAICYGHQFLARALCGKECVYKLPLPEYGYTAVKLKDHELFKNISSPICLQLHYDAVKNLSDDFEVIAENETCIQAIQFKGLDVYGLQFHPEFDARAAKHFLAEAEKTDANFPNFYRNELEDEKVLEQNALFIRNFLEL
jgi:GMP synthase (glutamine-hydrolysing)